MVVHAHRYVGSVGDYGIRTANTLAPLSGWPSGRCVTRMSGCAVSLSRLGRQ